MASDDPGVRIQMADGVVRDMDATIATKKLRHIAVVSLHALRKMGSRGEPIDLAAQGVVTAMSLYLGDRAWWDEFAREFEEQCHAGCPKDMAAHARDVLEHLDVTLAEGGG